MYRDETAEPVGRALVWVYGGAFIGGYLDMPESNWVALELASRGIPVLAIDYVKCLGDVHFPAPPFLQLSLNFSGGPEGLHDPHAFPGVGNPAGYPPTLVVVCELDRLRPSGEVFARRLRDAGSDATLYVEAGADHAHINEPADPAAARTIEAIAGWIADRS